MSLWDPEAAGNAAQYLRLGDLQMLEIRNRPFEGTKAIWVPHSETGYSKAELLGDDEKKKGHKLVLRADGKEKSVAEDKIDKQNPPKYELLEGTCNILYGEINIHLRFGKHDIFIRGCCCLQSF